MALEEAVGVAVLPMEAVAAGSSMPVVGADKRTQAEPSPVATPLQDAASVTAPLRIPQALFVLRCAPTGTLARVDCARSHPSARVTPCKDGAACTRADCWYAHPATRRDKPQAGTGAGTAAGFDAATKAEPAQASCCLDVFVAKRLRGVRRRRRLPNQKPRQRPRSRLLGPTQGRSPA